MFLSKFKATSFTEDFIHVNLLLNLVNPLNCDDN
ncbi:hypothetical protein SAMN05421682_11318 [Chryseobacterium indoltheticum]|uniref:Uncharacterized protein n=1 Tax=Chryseobacterium indoltheticum TaxID=254 RepID=A0A381F584_9FLAO|nr:hypothetical protein SAMN05421682_11318 [Chryseobacterium indoltheticum]SUX41657.1 Uncharacterised protein [Chryseobacterium indoltheticum]